MHIQTHICICKHICILGSEVDHVDARGWTALRVASEFNRKGMVMFLKPYSESGVEDGETSYQNILLKEPNIRVKVHGQEMVTFLKPYSEFGIQDGEISILQILKKKSVWYLYDRHLYKYMGWLRSVGSIEL